MRREGKGGRGREGKGRDAEYTDLDWEQLAATGGNVVESFFSFLLINFPMVPSKIQWKTLFSTFYTFPFPIHQGFHKRRKIYIRFPHIYANGGNVLPNISNREGGRGLKKQLFFGYISLLFGSTPIFDLVWIVSRNIKHRYPNCGVPISSWTHSRYSQWARHGYEPAQWYT